MLREIPYDEMRESYYYFFFTTKLLIRLSKE